MVEEDDIVSSVKALLSEDILKQFPDSIKIRRRRRAKSKEQNEGKEDTEIVVPEAITKNVSLSSPPETKDVTEQQTEKL